MGCVVRWVAMGLGVGWPLLAGMMVGAGPVVGGYHQLERGKAELTERGEVLLSELNCAACHTLPAGTRIEKKGGPELTQVGTRVTPQYLRKFISAPHETKAGTTMPDLLHGMNAERRGEAVESLVYFLVSLGGPIESATEAGNSALVEQGKQLYHTIGCVACHAPQDGKAPPEVPSVPLGMLAHKTTVDQLAAFLMDPLKARPAGRMPSMNLSAGEARALAVYLLREQMDNPQTAQAAPARMPGVRFSYYEAKLAKVDLGTLAKLKPVFDGRIEAFSLKIPKRRGDAFAIKYSGILAVPKDGKYTFFARSDDGSRVYIDGKDVAENDGVHGTTEKSGQIELTAGDHAIEVTFFEEFGGEELEVLWEGPGIKKQSVPAEALFSMSDRPMVPLESEKFMIDSAKVEEGKKLFVSTGCAACHAVGDLKSEVKAPKLTALRMEGGCLSAEVTNGIPAYGLSVPQRGAIMAALSGRKLDSPREAAEQVRHVMGTMNCYACHHRQGVGGPDAVRGEHFKMAGEFDMGDEGRIPPKLNDAGAKLTSKALERIIFESQLHVRPVLATRMPRFSREAMGGFVSALEKADLPEKGRTAPVFAELAAKDGRLLVGTKGLGCVNCHGVGGTKSLGMPAMDLASTHERLRPGWFHELLVNPAQKNPDTRMPQFWTDESVSVRGVAGDHRDSQIDAIWTYLSLGSSMALPTGLAPTNSYELVPMDEPIVQRTFMNEVGTRAIAVGYPDQLHVAFDANGVRMAKAWKGRFLDSKAMLEGRGGGAMGPGGRDVLNFAAGPAVARLATADAPWPVIKEKQRNVGGRFKGYRLNKAGEPTFVYEVDGVVIEEHAAPVLREGGAVLVRRLTLKSEKPVEGLHFLAGAGKSMEMKDGAYVVDGKLSIRLLNSTKAVLRESEGMRQIVVPITFDKGTAEVAVEMSW